jgi:penicillin V acylase-like amidase (Ntn superfamily)
MKQSIKAGVVGLAFLGQNLLACTTFSFSHVGEVWMANSLDWAQDHGQAVTNQRHVEKRAFLNDDTLRALQWTSKYGSLTFNQHGREFPLGGINEKGLTVETMWLDSSAYEPADERPVINELQWMQYQLDVSQTVAEAIENAKAVRVLRVVAPQHYLICDASRNCATFEFLGGKLVIHTGADLPVKVLTNNSYEESLRSLQSLPSGSQSLPYPNHSTSLARFANADWWVRHIPTSMPIVDFIFSGLKTVAQGDYSKWNLVYRLEDPQAYFRTLRAPTVKTVRLSSFALECVDQPTGKVLDLNRDMGGDVTQNFTPYAAIENRDMVEKSFRFLNSNFSANFSAETIAKIAKYPQTTRCQKN